jgi:hypothetical protein
LHLSDYRNLSAIRWIGQWTVRVYPVERKRVLRGVYLKADEGLEKAWLEGETPYNRRKRGLRKGKCRSRGGKPRGSTPNRPDLPKHGVWAAKRRSRVDRYLEAKTAFFCEKVGNASKAKDSEFSRDHMTQWQRAYEGFAVRASKLVRMNPMPFRTFKDHVVADGLWLSDPDIFTEIREAPSLRELLAGSNISIVPENHFPPPPVLLRGNGRRRGRGSGPLILTTDVERASFLPNPRFHFDDDDSDEGIRPLVRTAPARGVRGRRPSGRVSRAGRRPVAGAYRRATDPAVACPECLTQLGQAHRPGCSIRAARRQARIN